MKTKYSWIVVVLLGAFLTQNCSTKNTPPLTVPEGTHAGELVGMQECEYQPAGGKASFAAECGTLVVPENWDEAGSRLIALPVVRIAASAPNPAEPVFYLQGGPGQSNLSWVPPDWLLVNHDVVIVGYRGIDGMVTLACPEVNRLYKRHMGKDLLSPQAQLDYAGAVKACAATLRAAGVDLSGYTVPGVIKDMDAARTALKYERINLLSESYGTRVAQIYAYMLPETLHRLILIGVNTPGHFVWDPAVMDEMVAYLSRLCAQDAYCSSRTGNLAQTIYQVNHNMPERWLFFKIDPDSVRLGTHFMFLDNPNMAMIFDAYLAAAEGDPSGLAMLNLLISLAPVDQQIFGDQASKAGTLDLEMYGGSESVSLGDSIMGAPMAEWIWPLMSQWPIELISEDLREFQHSDVEMLLVNGTVDFSTPPNALDKASPYLIKPSWCSYRNSTTSPM
jgi:pimeloyl-ACP methyl ester carboxylesterase